MRISTAVIGCVVLLAVGCTTPPESVTPMPAGPATELVPLKIAFEESFPDNETAKRIVLCQLGDERTEKGYIGEGPVTGDRAAVSKYVLKDDPTLVLPRILAKGLKGIGFNLALAERLSDPVGGEPVRELLKRYSGDYLIAGRVEEISVRARTNEKRPVFVTVSARLDLYNKDGQLRMYYPARQSDVEFLGDKAGDPNEISALLQRVVDAMFSNALDDPYFCKALDLDPEAVKQMREGKPLPPKTEETKPAETTPAETKPTETKPAETTPPETKPAEPKPEEKPAATDADKKAKDLDDAVKGMQK